jgi:hypothetical protein
MIGKILLGIVVVLALFLGYAATRPSTYRVERARTMAAAPEVVFAKLNDFHAWPDWSPWEGLDPNMKRTLDGADRGVGASYYWIGNDKVGEGRMTITESVPSSRVGIKLEFMKPMAATNQTAFELAPEGAGTRVTWTMDGKNDFMGKVFTVFMDMDKMIGKDFEKGLGQLTTLVESEAAAAPADAVADTAAAH